MPRLTRVLKYYHKEIDGTLTWFDKVVDYIDDKITYRPDWYYRLENFLRNLPMFLRFADEYRSWDSHFSIEVFTKLLEDNAKSCKNGHHVGANKSYRRGMTMVGMLRKAYGYSCTNDKAYMYFATKYPWNIDGCTFKRPYEYGSKLDKLHNTIDKRCDATEKRLKQEAWQYVHKYIEHLWN